MMGYPNWSNVHSTGNYPNRRENVCALCGSRYIPSRWVPIFTFPFFSAYRYDAHRHSATGSLIVCSSCHRLTLEDRKQPEIIENPFAFVGFHKK